jgi:hypothetical protein
VRLAYKLFSVRGDGSIGPLFIDKAQRVPVGAWLNATCTPTKGFAVRQGWHACPKPIAPHLCLHPKGKARRVWCRVALGGRITDKKVSSAQGGEWLLADRMMVLDVLWDETGITKDNPGPDS